MLQHKYFRRKNIFSYFVFISSVLNAATEMSSHPPTGSLDDCQFLYQYHLARHIFLKKSSTQLLVLKV